MNEFEKVMEDFRLLKLWGPIMKRVAWKSSDFMPAGQIMRMVDADGSIVLVGTTATHDDLLRKFPGIDYEAFLSALADTIEAQAAPDGPGRR